MTPAPHDAGRSSCGAEGIAPHVLTAFREVAATTAALATLDPARRAAALHLLDELHAQFSVQALGVPA